MLKKILLFLAIFLVLGIFVAERMPRVKNEVGQYFQQVFESTFDCTMNYRVESVSLFSLTLTLADVTVKSRAHDAWHWHADKYITTLSWLDLLMAGMLGMQVTLENVTARSRYINNIPAIFDHLRLLVAGPSLRFVTFIKSLSLHHLDFSLNDPGHPLGVFAALDLITGRCKNCISLHCALADAHVTHGATALLSSANGTLDLQWYDSATTPDITASISCAATTPLLPSITNIVGTWDHDHGSLKLSTHDGLVHIDSCTFEKSEVGIKARAEAHADIKPLVGLFTQAMPVALEGSIVLTTSAEITPQGVQHIHGQARVSDVRYAAISLGKGLLTFAQKGAELAGDVHLESIIPLEGSYTLDMRKRALSGELHTIAAYAVPFTHWTFAPDAQISVIYDPHYLCEEPRGEPQGIFRGREVSSSTRQASSNPTCTTFKGAVGGELINTLTKEKTAYKGTYTSDGKAIALRGMFGSREFILEAILTPVPFITQLRYGPVQEPVLTIKQQKDASLTLTGVCDVTLLKEAAALWGYQVHGQGKLDVSAALADKMVTTTLALRDGTIQLPKLYNCISGLHATIVGDLRAKEITVRDVRCQFHKGAITCEHATIALNDAYHVKSAHVPIVLDSWLLAAAGEFSAELSGALSYNHKPDQVPHIAGEITIDHAKTRENIFSEGFLKRIRGSVGVMQPQSFPEVTCSLVINTRTPFHVQTDFLETDAHLKLRVGNRVAAPELSGSIELAGGQLLFPYKPLFIRKGALYFVPGRSLDPLLELTAQNTIKSHDVRLQLTGSLGAPSVMLDSTPSLREEQVASLLLVGIPEVSLASVAPALVTTNITSLLVDNIQSSQTLSHYFGALLKPLKHIHVIPRFSDQSARGGIRTAIEVDVGDRWRGLIQKNLSLTEDTRLEVEYRVSDDVSLKGTRNERGDVSGEVEMHIGF